MRTLNLHDHRFPFESPNKSWKNEKRAFIFIFTIWCGGDLGLATQRTKLFPLYATFPQYIAYINALTVDRQIC